MKKVVLLTMILIVGLVQMVYANVYLGHDSETDSDVYIDEHSIPQYNLYQTQANLHFVKNGEDTYKPVLINWDYSTAKTRRKLVYRYDQYGDFINVKPNHWSWAMADFLKDKKKLPKERIFMKFYENKTHYKAFDRARIDVSRAIDTGWVGVTIVTFRKSDGRLTQRIPAWFTKRKGIYYVKFMKFENSISKMNRIGHGTPYMIVALWLNDNGNI